MVWPALPTIEPSFSRAKSWSAELTTPVTDPSPSICCRKYKLVRDSYASDLCLVNKRASKLGTLEAPFLPSKPMAHILPENRVFHKNFAPSRFWHARCYRPFVVVKVTMMSGLESHSKSWSAVGSHGRCRLADGRLGDTLARGFQKLSMISLLLNHP